MENMFQTEKIVVYGAGKLARLLYTYLDTQSQSGNIQYFVVTNQKNNPKELFGKPVAILDEALGDMLETNIKVVVAIGERYRALIVNELRIRGITNICELGTAEKIQKKIFEYYSKYPLENKIFFSSFLGRVCADSPKYIALKMIEKFPGAAKLVWEFENGFDGNLPHDVKKVYKNTPEYFYELYTSKIIVTNNVPYANKRHGSVVIETWHGFGFKCVGIDANAYDNKTKERVIRLSCNTDIYISCSDNYQKIFRESFASNAPIYDFGSPRNDILFDQTFDKQQVFKTLGVDISNKIVLYAPTFRDDIDVSFEKYIIDSEKIVKALEHRFGGKYVFVYRFHSMLYEKVKNNTYFPNGVNATFYPDTQELLVAADVLISDYSSIMWDFSLQKRPVFMLHNDVNEYVDDRGFYSSPETWPYERAFDNDDLCQKIINFDGKAYLTRLEQFIQDNKSYDDGYASERCCDLIMNIMQHPEAYEYKG